MCGVAGIVQLGAGGPPSVEELARMAATLRHRGPDAQSVYRDARVGLAHARLAIVDLAGGGQPLANARGDVWVAYNGEIYNHVELRAELEAAGHAFRTRCDTEVLVAAYEAWGDDCVRRFEGQFAFAIWDAKRRRLLFGRDRFGVRPLYFARAGTRLAFASEVKALFCLDDVPRAIDPETLDEVFTFWTPLAPRSGFAGVRELRPGHVAVLDLDRGGELEERPWFEPLFPERAARGATKPPIEESVAALEGALERSTALRLLRADVPVGCYLSGGIDSSVVAALARRAHGGELRTFSIRFADADYDEGPFQRLMVERLETRHEDIVVDRADVARAFVDVVYHVERPILRTAPAPLFLLSRLVRDAGVKVVLTGEGSDELLAGYDLFREDKVRRFWAKHPASEMRPLLVDRLYPWLGRGPREAREMARRFFGRDLDPSLPEFSHAPRFRAASALKRLFSAELASRLAGRDAVAELRATLPEGFLRWGPLSRAQYLEIRTLLSGYLLSAQGDRAGMAHSVEGRFPFLDAEVFEAARRMPEAHRLHVLDEKHVLKLLARRLVPAEILERPKQPYRAPDAVSFVSPGAPAYVAELLSERAVRDAGLFDPAAVARLAAKCRAAADVGDAAGRALSNADNMAFVGVLSAQILWHELVQRGPRPADGARVTVIDRAGG